MDSTTPVLDIQGLTQSYGSEAILTDVSLRFQENQIYGLLGRNGAGKTTLLNSITNRILPDRGQVRWLGEDLSQRPGIIRQVCYMPEKNYFQDLKLHKLLNHGKHFFFPDLDLEYAKDLAARFELDLNKRQGKLSKGQGSIFKIIFGLASRALITIFDEPIIGLDAVARDLFYRELIAAYGLNPRMFIVSTHLIEELANAFSEVVILKNGTVYCQESVEALLEKTFCVSGKSDDVDEFSKSYSVLGSETFGGMKRVAVEGKAPGEDPTGLQVSSISLQQLFIYLTSN